MFITNSVNSRTIDKYIHAINYIKQSKIIIKTLSLFYLQYAFRYGIINSRSKLKELLNMNYSDLNKFLGFVKDHDKEVNNYSINLKESNQFRVGFEFLQCDNFNIEVSLNQFEGIGKTSYFDTYLIESNRVNKFFRQMIGTEYMYYFSLLHEIGHILSYMNCDFESADVNNSYASLSEFNYSYERFEEYRKLNIEQIADNYAIDFINSHLDDIIKFALNIDAEELEMWKMLTV
jgi:hypothetical protein